MGGAHVQQEGVLPAVEAQPVFVVVHIVGNDRVVNGSENLR